jgi:FkbM family methyltransferase
MTDDSGNTSKDPSVAASDFTPPSFDELMGYPIFSASVAAGDRHVIFALDDPLDEIQRIILKGLFYEREQLDYHRSLIPHHGRVLDVGANLGNHSTYYAMVCEAELVIAIEPARRAVRLFEATLHQNDLPNIELHPATAAGAGTGWAILDHSEAIQHNLGGTAIKVVPKQLTGSIRVLPADEIIGERPIDFIKIDVEGTEMQVLTGLQRTVDRDRPVIAVEIMPESRSAFAQWCDVNNYRIERTFQMYRNILNFVCVARD